MKKIGLVLAALMLAASLTACNEKVSAYGAYEKMNTAMGKVESIEMTVDGSIAMTAMGETMDIEMSGTMKEVILSETEAEMEMYMDMVMFGETIPTVSYYKDGYMYQEMYGMKYKTAMGIEEALSQMGTENLTFSEEAIKESDVTDVDGGKQISFTLDGAALNDILAGAGTLSELAALFGEDGEMAFGDVTYVVNVDKDYVMKSCEMRFDMTMTVEGEAIEMAYTMTMKVVSTNDVTVTFPDDLDTYVGMSDALGAA